MTPLQLICAAVLLAGAAVADVVSQTSCEESLSNVCVVKEVRINSCGKSRACRLKKGSTATISFDYTPYFSATSLKAGLFHASSNGDMPFAELQDADACPFTTCPVESGKSQQLTYSLRLSKLLPKGTFLFKWKLWNSEDNKQVCCFKTEVKLR